MFTYRCIVLLSIAGLVYAAGVPAQTGEHGLGRTATDAEIAGWDIDVPPSGDGLPAGSGTAAEGESIYQSQCVACHGPKGEDGPMARLAGGGGTLATDSPVKTVGSYWPYATTLYDYIHRAMPLVTPQSLSPDQTYAVTAYVLFLNDIVDRNDQIDAQSLAAIQMPNRDGFVSPDPRPDTQNTACMSDCGSNDDPAGDGKSGKGDSDSTM